jgi:hypothetical protein
VPLVRLIIKSLLHGESLWDTLTTTRISKREIKKRKKFKELDKIFKKRDNRILIQRVVNKESRYYP